MQPPKKKQSWNYAVYEDKRIPGYSNMIYHSYHDSYITPMQLYLTINGTVFGIHVVEYMLTLGVNVFEFMPIMK